MRKLRTLGTIAAAVVLSVSIAAPASAGPGASPMRWDSSWGCGGPC